VDEVLAFIAPRIVGGATARSPVEGAGVERLADALELSGVETCRVGEDILITGKIKR
jgi:diaminohydroxyphosphoribosylaminopyrimidine deaminase/5-amino-6-(5-phosphoribosylamino)uracil reductase